jgi:ribosomal protein S18 acetylase RimI-like enzyme
MAQDPRLVPMHAGHIDAATEIMALGRNEIVGTRARATFTLHFRLKDLGVDDGRSYFVWLEEGRVAGVTGLHHYSWGPDENVWLAYFGVHPDFGRRGIGAAMLSEMQGLARANYRRFFIETHGANERAHAFYRSQGFREAGEIEDYNPDGAAMKVFVKDLE